jgi:hypothetical protein
MCEMRGFRTANFALPFKVLANLAGSNLEAGGVEPAGLTVNTLLH